MLYVINFKNLINGT